MLIWVIGRGFPDKGNNMRGSFELEQARLLSEYGAGENKVTYITAAFHPYKRIRKWGFCTFREGSIQVFATSVFYAPERVHLHLKRFQTKIWKNLLTRAEQETGIPDIIHVHYPSMITIADPILEYKKRGTKVVATEHWTKVLTNNLDSFQKAQLKDYTEGADRFLCVGNPLKDAVERITNTQREIGIMPNVVSDLFKPRNACVADSRYRFVAVGRLVPHKQMDKVVRAFSKAFAGSEDADLYIVGDGTERKKLQAIVEEEKLEGKVMLAGTLCRQETAEIVSGSDALICFSRLETFGVPVIEAWACGKPVIASDCLGFAEYWNEDLGIVVPHDDVDALARAMVFMRDNGRKRYDAESIARYAAKNFGEQAIYQKLMAVYSSTIDTAM